MEFYAFEALVVFNEFGIDTIEPLVDPGKLPRNSGKLLSDPVLKIDQGFHKLASGRLSIHHAIKHYERCR